ncbi:MAG TPA: glycosyltransferase [Anaerolineae bacterium]|nr:glycosyltransferase [Anaerolineae bacterium]HOR00220.1 glycosyltransferase [Anaerolineae bacterium]HPL28265.1 glycosyltransferase [Anaerolineae bacterium]
MSERGRVAMISEHANPLAFLGSEDAGGQNVYVYEVSTGLARLGYRVDVFTRRDSPAPPQIVRLAPGVRVVHIAAGPAEFIKKDALWAHMPAFMEGCRACIAAQRRRYDVIHSNFWMSGWVACELKARLGLPFVHIFHALGAIKRLEQGAADTSPAGRHEMELRIIREVDRLIAQCPAEVDDLRRYYTASLANVCVVPSGVNIRRYRPVPRRAARARLGLRADERIAGYVGRLVPRKGVDTLMAAFARVAVARPAAPLRLMVVGGETRDPEEDPTPEMARLRGLAAELGVAERVWFVGKRQPDELAEYYGAADVMVSVPWYEPFGLTPLEAQACGRAFIGSAVGGITYTVDEGVTGLLVPPRDDAALADKLALLLSDAPLRHRLGRAGRRRVEREFTWARVAERTAAVYETLRPAVLPIAIGGVPVPSQEMQ